jgi:hypothetical protein
VHGVQFWNGEGCAMTGSRRQAVGVMLGLVAVLLVGALNVKEYRAATRNVPWGPQHSMLVMKTGPNEAEATDVIWTRFKIPWSDKTGTAFTGSAKDTVFITDENDTTRTDILSTADWAWDALDLGVATAITNVATLTLTCNVNNGAADTIYASIEKCNGKCIRNRTLSAATGACLVLQGDARADKALYRGVLQYDPDAPAAVNVIQPGDDFRLVVQGDQGGTTPKLSQCRIYVTYPKRAQTR